MLVLASYTAALYAAVLIPFKFGLPLVPGATEIRPGIAVLLLCSFLFGPAAAWGGAFGNLIGDFFGGTIGPGSLFGFPGNFLYGYLPYKLWELMRGGPITGSKGFGWWVRFVVVCWVSSAVCASVIAWGIELVFHVPVMFLGGIIFSNNLLLPLLLGPVLIRVIAPRLDAWGLTYERIEPNHPRAGAAAPVGAVIMSVTGIAAGVIMLVGFAAMFLPAVGLYRLERFPQLKAALELLAQPASLTHGGYTRAMVIVTVIVGAFIVGAFILGHEKPGKMTDDAGVAGVGAQYAAPLHNDKTALENVTFAYASSDKPALKNVSFSIKPGEYVVVMGRTGAGKTSLTRCLTGAIPHFFTGRISGKAYLFGYDPAQTGPAENADRVGMVFQDFESQLFSTNAELEVAFGAENLGRSREKLREAVNSSLKMAGLEGFENRNPATLSGGEKQRLAIASILAMAPPLVILDEPSTDLDPVGKREIFDLLATIREGNRPVILVEHEIEAARRADRIVIMRGGEICREGASQEIFRDPGLLLDHGIRPLDGVRLLCALGDNKPPLTVEEQIDRLKHTGRAPRDEEYKALEDDDAKKAALYGEVLYDLRDLHHSYAAGKESLNGINLSIRKGEFIAVLGQNGSGKTTLAKHLNGLFKPTTGEALFKGRKVTDRPLSAVAREVGFVFQDPDHQIFSSTVGDEVAFAPRNFGFAENEIARRVKKAIESTSLTGYEDKDPFHLTKGERQRVAVAGVLAGEPEALILDEPTTGLDRDEQVRIMELLKKLNSEGHTVIIITHTVWVAAEYAHRTVLLAGGHVIADGPTRKVFGMDGQLRIARVQPPDITAIGKAFGKVFLSVEEYLRCIST